MTATNRDGVLDKSLLQKFSPFNRADDDLLLILASRVNVQQLLPGQPLFEKGAEDPWDYYLLEGELELIAQDGRCRKIKANTPEAANPIARLKPRQYDARAVLGCEVLAVSSELVQVLHQGRKAQEASPHILQALTVDEYDTIEDADNSQYMDQLRSALERNQFRLPSLPEVALRVRDELEKDTASATSVARVVNADPAIAAKLLKAANSSLFVGASHCESTNAAVVRLGLDTTRQLVLSFVMKDIFKVNDAETMRQARSCWQYSVDIASIASVIARMGQGLCFSAEESLLAGLVHDVGTIGALAYFDSQEPPLSEDARKQALAAVSRNLGELILGKWGFAQNFVDCVSFSDQWQRTHSGKAELVDVIQVAKLHSYMLHHRHLPIARVDLSPAFQRLNLGELTPQLTIKILEQSHAQVVNVKRLLHGQ